MRKAKAGLYVIAEAGDCPSITGGLSGCLGWTLSFSAGNDDAEMRHYALLFRSVEHAQIQSSDVFDFYSELFTAEQWRWDFNIKEMKVDGGFLTFDVELRDN